MFLTTDDIATLRPGIETHTIEPGEAFWNFRELPTFVLNEAFGKGIDAHVGSRPLSFVYQRYSLNNYAGILAARRFGVPLVLEYNGSEIWMSRHWGRPLKYERLSQRIERLNLTLPEVIVVVSRAMGREVIGRGADPDAVLVNPNGVDPDRFHPAIDGAPVREQYGLGDATVVGFIGTFGPWHGADVLARAFVELFRRGARASRIKLLMIGDGSTLTTVKRILSDGGAPRCLRYPVLATRAEPGRDAVFRLADQALRVHGDGTRHRRVEPRSDWRGARARPHGVDGAAGGRRRAG
jgi:glycosyltransferase involved in cell wall biosynthesis